MLLGDVIAINHSQQLVLQLTSNTIHHAQIHKCKLQCVSGMDIARPLEHHSYLPSAVMQRRKVGKVDSGTRQ